MLTRRRFIAITAALAPTIAFGQATDLHVETGQAMGTRVTLRLMHPDAPRLAPLAMAEVARLEQIFSLYLPDSSLARLNRDGQLADPPFELLDCLSIASAVHAASDGAFDPTVQPLWRAEALAREAQAVLAETDRATAHALVGWSHVVLDPAAITLRPRMALTLNGIAQGYVADRVAALLADHGLTRALIDTGEIVALPDGSWPVKLQAGGAVQLRNRAMATSAPLAMTFGGDGRSSHILDPRTGHPVAPRWRAITVSAPRAALADALSTAACLAQDRAGIDAVCRQFPGAAVEAAVPA